MVPPKRVVRLSRGPRPLRAPRKVPQGRPLVVAVLRQVAPQQAVVRLLQVAAQRLLVVGVPQLAGQPLARLLALSGLQWVLPPVPLAAQ